MTKKLQFKANQQYGFTLMETMVAVAIVGILSSVALPSYMNSVKSGKLVEGPEKLSYLFALIEQNYMDNHSYKDTSDNTKCNLQIPSQTNYFSFSCQIVGSGYLLKAQSKSDVGLGSSGSYVYTLDQNGVKSTTDFEGASVTDKTCWLSNSGQCT